SPLVGDIDFAASFAGRRVERYVDCLDLVARVPPFIYRHLDGLRYIDRHGKVHLGGLSWRDAGIDSAQAGASYPLLLRRRSCPLRELADHAPINYVSAILGVRTDG